MLVVGFLVNNSNLIIIGGWRERVAVNETEMVFEKKLLKEFKSLQIKEITIDDLDIEYLRYVLALEGPTSSIFVNEITGKRNFGNIGMYFEYYWVSLSFLASSGEMIFNIMYFVFSIQGLIQSKVFYSFHLLDVINRFESL